jgi:phage-related protein
VARDAILSIKILTDATAAQKGLGQAEKSVGKFQKGIGKAAPIAAGALLAVGAAAITMGRAAADDAQSQALLSKALKNATGASDAQVASVEDSIAAMSAATGVADDELRPAMATLVRATGSAEKSQSALSAALDISAATGKDVDSVSKALAKGYAGNTSALGRLVPGIDKAVLATGDMDAIMAELARTTGGSAAAAADTAAGRMQRMQVAMDEAQESIGAALLPAMSKFATVLAKVAGFVQKHSTLFVILAGVLATVAAAILVINAVTTIYTAVSAVAGAVSGAAWLAALWPILAVIAAIALVVGAIVLLWKKNETFRRVVLAVWAAIKTAVAAVASWFKSAWRVVFAAVSAYVRAYAAVVRAVFNAIRVAVSAIVSFFKTAWRVAFSVVSVYLRTWRAVLTAAFNGAKAVASAVAGAIRRVWDSVFGALKRAASGLGSVLSGPFHTIERAVNAVIGAIRNLISWFGRIRVPKISLPKIPGFNATTSVAAAPVAPTGLATAASRAGATTRASSPTSGAVVININGAIDPESTARQVRRILTAHDRRMGRGGAGLRAGTV